MEKCTRIFSKNNSCRGTVLMEFLLTIALAGTLLPFIYQYQQRAVERAQNIMVMHQMQKIQTVFERYIVDNKDEILTTIGRNIIRLKLSDLVEYGLDESFVEEMGDRYQLRILKSIDKNNQSALQGVVVFSDSEITPLRTREIIALGDDKVGFIDGTRAYGGFGTWRTSLADLGIEGDSGIIQRTNTNRDNSLYLWRIPSDKAADATMLSGLNLGFRDIQNVAFVNSTGARFDEILEANKINVKDLIFEIQTTLDSEYTSMTGIVSGTLTSDARTMDVRDTINLSEYGKFTEIVADNLWVNNLNLSGLSIGSDDLAILNVSQSLDMTEGRISALSVTVGFTGSLTAKLNVRDKIIDSKNSDYYWDVKNSTARLVDISSPSLNDMVTKVLSRESVSGSVATSIFSGVAANKNATMGDFLNALREIQSQVRIKYRQLNLE